MSHSALALAVFWVALGVAACGGSQDSRPRAENPNIPRQGIGAGGDMGPPARDMPGKGRGYDTPHSKP